MPASPTSLLLEQRYRNALLARARQAVALIRERFAGIDPTDIGASYEAILPALVAYITLGQRDAQMLAYQFLAALAAEEVGEPKVPTNVAGNIAGTTADGRSIQKALAAFIPATFLAIRRGLPVSQAINIGRYGVARMAHTEITDAAWRETSHQGEASGGEMSGWTWVVGGSNPCGACLANQNGRVHSWSRPMGRHAGCSCIESPVYRDAPEKVKRPTGMELFTAMSAAQQIATFRTAGEAKAALVRSGRITLDDLVEVQEHYRWRDSITEKPLEALGISEEELAALLT